MTVAMLFWGVFLPYLLHKGCLLQLTVVPYCILAVGGKPSCLSVFNPITFISPKLIPRKGNPDFVPIHHLISDFQPGVHYLPFNCNQGKAGCVPCIVVKCEKSVENLIGTDIFNFFVACIVVYHRFEEAKKEAINSYLLTVTLVRFLNKSVAIVSWTNK